MLSERDRKLKHLKDFPWVEDLRICAADYLGLNPEVTFYGFSNQHRKSFAR